MADPAETDVLSPINFRSAMARVMTAVVKDDTELFKQFRESEAFRRW
jgi:type I restriction enzyme R subunit